MKLTRKILKPYVDAKLINEIKHPTEDLCMYKYTASCTFEKHWDEVTLQCRGIILDSNDNIIAWPFDKFFNYEEHASESLPKIPTNIEYDIYTKLDGSLGISYIIGDKIYITTSGSFTSDQGVKATEILYKKYYNCIQKMLNTYCNFTYLFEIIYPEDLHVVNYHDMEDIILIGIRNRITGHDIDINALDAEHKHILLDFNVVYIHNIHNEYKDFAKLQSLNIQNEEGFVIRYKNAFRVKVKFADYIILHRNKAMLSKKTILQSLSDGIDILPVLPEEDRKWAESIINELKYEFLIINLIINMWVCYLNNKYKNVNDLHQFKKLCANGIFTNNDMKQYSAAIFQGLDNKDYTKTIWNYIKNKDK